MAYLIDNPPAIAQYRSRSRLTGCTVLHTAEGVMDTIGPDTGAEATADFIRRRTTYGSYHDLADSDSYVNLIPYHLAAFHDGTGSNDWALSISFACHTSDWRAMSPEKRRAFLRQGARAFAAQQAWRRANGKPLTELRYITKAQSDAGLSGFIEHGRRDPGRRTDPGISAPNLFPYDEWLTECQAALDGTSEEDDMFEPGDRAILETIAKRLRGPEDRANDVLQRLDELVADIHNRVRGGDPNMDNLQALSWQIAQVSATVAAGRDDVDEQALAQQITAGLVPTIMTAVGDAGGLTAEQVDEATKKALREVFAAAAAAAAAS